MWCTCACGLSCCCMAQVRRELHSVCLEALGSAFCNLAIIVQGDHMVNTPPMPLSLQGMCWAIEQQNKWIPSSASAGLHSLGPCGPPRSPLTPLPCPRGFWKFWWTCLHSSSLSACTGTASWVHAPGQTSPVCGHWKQRRSFSSCLSNHGVTDPSVCNPSHCLLPAYLMPPGSTDPISLYIPSLGRCLILLCPWQWLK